MAIFSIYQNTLIKIQVKILNSLPSVIYTFQTSSAFQKNKSKIMAVIRSITKTPAKKFIINITPAGFMYKDFYIELPIFLEIYTKIKKYNLKFDYLIFGEIDLYGNILPLNQKEICNILYNFLILSKKQNFILIIPKILNTELDKNNSIYFNIKNLGINFYEVSNIKELIKTIDKLEINIDLIFKTKIMSLDASKDLINEPKRPILIIGNYKTNFNKKINTLFAEDVSNICSTNLSETLNFDNHKTSGETENIQRNSHIKFLEYLYFNQKNLNNNLINFDIRPIAIKLSNLMESINTGNCNTSIIDQKPIYNLSINSQIEDLSKVLNYICYGTLILNNLLSYKIKVLEYLIEYINFAKYEVNPLTNEQVIFNLICTSYNCPCGFLESKRLCFCNMNKIQNFKQRLQKFILDSKSKVIRLNVFL